jgi:hypothetical protein
MRTALVLALAVLFPAAVTAADVSGTWLGGMDSPYGLIDTTITLNLAESALSGTVATQFFQSKIENAKIDGDRISFEINTEYGKIVYAGTIADDEIKFDVTGGPDNSQMKLTVKKPK